MNLDAINRRLQDVLNVHLDPEWGSAYWLDRQRQLGFDIRKKIKSVHDLSQLGFMEQSDLNSRPLLDFIPRRFHDSLSEFILGQTGGTTDQPAWTVYNPEEFEEAFITPFLRAADHVGFPTKGPWLFVGPSGPHIIGQAARRIARTTGNMEPFTVDFDPRWAKKISPGSLAAQRYLNHVVEQALSIIEHQNIRVLFTTPSVISRLGQAMNEQQRQRIQGVHYGGQPVTRRQIEDFRSTCFSNAIHLSGYGNTLFGCCLELNTASHEMAYYPYGSRIWFSEYSSPGRQPLLSFCRFDKSMLLINFCEQDIATITLFDQPLLEGFQPVAILNPQRKKLVTPPEGLY